MTTTIADYLLARIAEVERIAEGAERTSGRREWNRYQFGAGGFDARVDDHLALHDPAYVLADCRWKRTIVEAARGVASTRDAYASYADDDPMFDGIVGTYHSVMRMLAQPFADRDDFDPEWRL